MTPHPLRLILTSYALATLVAIAIPQLGLLGQVLTVWLGGSALMFGLATTPGVKHFFRKPMPTESSDDDLKPATDTDTDTEYQRWDEDALLEAVNADADEDSQTAKEAPTRATGTG